MTILEGLVGRCSGRKSVHRIRRGALGALVAAGVLTACTSGGQPAPATPSISDSFGGTPIASAPRLVSRVVAPAALAVVSDDYASYADSGTHRIVASSIVRVLKDKAGLPMAHMRESVAEFPLPSGCIENARLELGKPSSEFPAESISVYPSNLSFIARVADATPRPQPAATLLDNRPRGIVSVAGGVAAADVTDIARLWQKGGPFPSKGEEVRVGSPLALAVIYSDLTDGHFDVTFPQARLQLALAGAASCPT